MGREDAKFEEQDWMKTVQVVDPAVEMYEKLCEACREFYAAKGEKRVEVNVDLGKLKVTAQALDALIQKAPGVDPNLFVRRADRSIDIIVGDAATHSSFTRACPVVRPDGQDRVNAIYQRISSEAEIVFAQSAWESDRW